MVAVNQLGGGLASGATAPGLLYMPAGGGPSQVFAGGAAGSVLAMNGAGTGYAWNTPSFSAPTVYVVSTASVTAVVNQVAYVTFAGTSVITLPAITATTTSVNFFGIRTQTNSSLAQVAQIAAQQGFFLSYTTTSGTGGSIAIPGGYQSLQLVGTTTANQYMVDSCTGTITLT